MEGTICDGIEETLIAMKKVRFARPERVHSLDSPELHIIRRFDHHVKTCNICNRCVFDGRGSFCELGSIDSSIILEIVQDYDKQLCDFMIPPHFDAAIIFLDDVRYGCYDWLPSRSHAGTQKRPLARRSRMTMCILGGGVLGATFYELIRHHRTKNPT